MKLKVLIVDDDTTVIYLHHVVLVETGFADVPFAFTSCKETLEFIMKGTPGTEAFLVLLDINMPVMDGWQFLDSLVQAKLSLPVYVVIVTSSIDTSDKKKANGYESVIAFLEKPVRAEDLNQLRELKELRKYF